MFRTKEEFDAHLEALVSETMIQAQLADIYEGLVGAYRFRGVEDLKFLADMPFEQGRAWVDKTFLEYIKLRKVDPERFSTNDPIEITRIMRQYRKQKNKAAKERATARKSGG